MIIIVTGTIAPGEQSYLAIKSVEERVLQYRKTLRQIIMSNVGLPIVFCENSGYGTDEMEDLIDIARQHNCSLELLSFLGDKDAVRLYGKGYGEGEILEYVLQHSRLISKKHFFIKITGRLEIDNLCSIVKKVKKNQIYLNVPNIHRRDIYDTRIYGMPILVYKQFFVDCFRSVNDGAGYFLEHAFTDVVLDKKLHVKNLPSYPRIVGVSGSNGQIYGYTVWKSIIRDMLSNVNLYGRIKR